VNGEESGPRSFTTHTHHSPLTIRYSPFAIRAGLL
jgi:hypothetical protein